MTSSEVWDAETAERYDATSAEMFAPDVLGPTVDFLARLAGTGPALELAIGTGRVAVPLAAGGVPGTWSGTASPTCARRRSRWRASATPPGTYAPADGS